MTSRMKPPATVEAVAAQLIESLPHDAKAAKHAVLSGSAHKLRAVVKVCERALVVLEDAVLWKFEKTQARCARLTIESRQKLVDDALAQFDPLVKACVALIHTEVELVNGTSSLPFVLGLFDAKRLSVIAAIRLQILGGQLPLSGVNGVLSETGT